MASGEQPDPLLPGRRPAGHRAVDRPPSPAEFEAIARANATFIQSCVDATGELMAHLSSLDTADDVERIRQALSPNDGLVAYGGSYGSPYATAYLERYGEHVKALVLDGVVDHSVDLATFMGRNVLAVDEAIRSVHQLVCSRTAPAPSMAGTWAGCSTPR